MASVRDILPRAAAVGAGVVYVGAPSKWLLKLAGDAAKQPVIVNVKGLPADLVPVVLTLAEYERLQGKAGE